MLEELKNGDWDEAFKYASPHVCSAGHAHGPSATIMSPVSTAEFTREDVTKIIALREGENDGESWVGIFALKDGRFAVLRAWCDYTGWG